MLESDIKLTATRSSIMNLVKNLNIPEQGEILIGGEEKRFNILRELFGSGKIKRSTTEILKEARRELDD